LINKKNIFLAIEIILLFIFIIVFLNTIINMITLSQNKIVTFIINFFLLTYLINNKLLGLIILTYFALISVPIIGLIKYKETYIYIHISLLILIILYILFDIFFIMISYGL
jgi:hypothetical protein